MSKIYQQVDIQDSGKMVVVGELYKFTYRYNIALPFNDPVKDVEDWIHKSAQHFKIIGVFHDTNLREITAWCEVVNNPLPFLVVFGGIVLGVSIMSFMIGLSLEKVEQVLDSPGGEAVASSLSIAVIVGAAVAVKLFFFR